MLHDQMFSEEMELETHKVQKGQVSRGQDKQIAHREPAGDWGLGVSERQREAKDVGEIQQGLRKPSHRAGSSILSQAF